LIAAFTACSNDDNTATDERVEAKITAGVGELTRATGATWEEGDVIGVYVTDVTGTTEGYQSTMASLYKNVKYTLASGANTGTATFSAASADRIFFQDNNETVTFAAYGPYQADASSITIDTEKNNTADTQKSIDLIYASGAKASKASPEIAFKGENEFRHVMSKLILNIKLGTGFSSETLPSDAKIELSGLIHKGTFSLTGDNAGKAVPDSSATAVANWDVTSSYGSLILLPQDLSKTPLTIAITINGQTYKNSVSITPNMQPGTSYSYNISVALTGISVTGSTIAEWESGTGGDGKATL
jgi:hypothetical protein